MKIKAKKKLNNKNSVDEMLFIIYCCGMGFNTILSAIKVLNDNENGTYTFFNLVISIFSCITVYILI